MAFQDQMRTFLDARYKDELFLADLFLDLYGKLEAFDDSLEKYAAVGLDVVFEAAENAAALRVEDRFLRFDVVFDETEPFIQVSAGKTTEEEPDILDKARFTICGSHWIPDKLPSTVRIVIVFKRAGHS